MPNGLNLIKLEYTTQISNWFWLCGEARWETKGGGQDRHKITQYTSLPGLAEVLGVCVCDVCVCVFGSWEAPTT